MTHSRSHAVTQNSRNKILKICKYFKTLRKQIENEKLILSLLYTNPRCRNSKGIISIVKSILMMMIIFCSFCGTLKTEKPETEKPETGNWKWNAQVRIDINHR